MQMWIKLYTQQGPALREARSGSPALFTYISLKNNSPFPGSFPVTKARIACHGHKHKKWGVFQLRTFHFLHANVDLSTIYTGDAVVWAELVIRQGGHMQGMHSRRFTQEVWVHVHALSNSAWGCDSVPLGRHILAALFQSSLQTGCLLCASCQN